MTVTNRGACRPCRLKKCFSNGLQKEMVRGPYSKRCCVNKTNQQQSSTNISHRERRAIVPTLDLLRNDRSLLTVEQWSLLSNVSKAYDDKSCIFSIQNAIALHSVYPSKIRLKMAKYDFEHIYSLWHISVGPFMDKLMEFKSLLLSDQVALIERNIRSVGGVCSIIIIRETDLYSNPYLHNGVVAAYGSVLTKRAMKIIDQTDIDVLLLKLCLPLMVFSTCSDILNPKFTINNSE